MCVGVPAPILSEEVLLESPSDFRTHVVACCALCSIPLEKKSFTISPRETEIMRRDHIIQTQGAAPLLRNWKCCTDTARAPEMVTDAISRS